MLSIVFPSFSVDYEKSLVETKLIDLEYKVSNIGFNIVCVMKIAILVYLAKPNPLCKT